MIDEFNIWSLEKKRSFGNEKICIDYYIYWKSELWKVFIDRYIYIHRLSGVCDIILFLFFCKQNTKLKFVAASYDVRGNFLKWQTLEGGFYRWVWF